jgi:hypothetical protein
MNMKTMALGVCIFLPLLYPLSAQNAFYFEEYDDLRPDINRLAANSSRNDHAARNLLFYTFGVPYRGDDIWVCKMPERTLIALSDNQIEIDKRNMIKELFWDPHTSTNYVRLSDAPNLYVIRKEGWYSFLFSDGFLSFHLQDEYRYWAAQSPPYVQLNDSRQFSSHYAYDGRERLPNSYLPAYRSFLRVTDINSGRTIWELTEVIYGFLQLYWVTESWYIRKSSPSFISGDWERQNEIFNFETGGITSFAPDTIIGYGRGVVLTTTETENGFIGITVWISEEAVLFRNSNFAISGIIDQLYWGQEPGIDIAYYDYPYIYCNISRIGSFGMPYGTLIMDLIDGKTYYTKNRYHLFGIF